MGSAVFAAAFSAAIIAAVVVAEFDLRDVRDRIARRRNRVAYVGVMSAFLALVGAGEGYAVFTTIFPPNDVPRGAELLTKAGLALMAVWSIAVRPLRSSAVLCPLKDSCPVVLAEIDARAFVGGKVAGRIPLPVASDRH
jgi:hypothetical protein